MKTISIRDDKLNKGKSKEEEIFDQADLKLLSSSISAIPFKAFNPEEINRLCRINNDSISVEQILTSSSITQTQVIYSSSHKYLGEVDENDLPHGMGICQLRNGCFYSGQFSKGQFDGFGKLLLPGGELVSGLFSQGKLGKYSIMRKGSMSCEWYNEGETTIVFIQIGEESSAEIVLLQGYQIVKLHLKERNIMFEGVTSNIFESDFSGWATLNFNKELLYCGQISNSSVNGYGEIYSQGGIKFFGQFKDNKKNGLSLQFLQNTQISLGHYQDNFRHGPFLVKASSYTTIELYNYGFRSRSFERLDPAKSYFKQFYPEFLWVQNVNMKKLSETFAPFLKEVSERNTIELGIKSAEVASEEKNNPKKLVKTKKEISLVQRIRESMRMDSA